MISSVKWIPKGYAKQKPIKYEISAEELRQLQAQESAFKNNALKETQQMENKTGVDRNGIPLSLRMDDYGEDFDDSRNFDNGNSSGSEDEELMAEEMMKKTMKDQISSSDEDEDMDDDEEMEEKDEPETTNGEQSKVVFDEEDDEFSSDEEDFTLKDSDKMVVVAQTDDDFSILEVYLYDDEEGSLYVHHDISLPAFPLCLCWVGCGVDVFGNKVTTDSRNYIATGTFKPEIEIWNLDVIDALEPSLILGDSESGGHSDAVMGLSWNELHQKLLASSSADKTVKLWDMSAENCAATFSHHTDKVQSVAWNPVESSVLLSGSFDRSICVFDAQATNSLIRMKLKTDVECAVWNIHRPEQVLASTEDGFVTCFDVRNASAGPLYSFQAHKKPCSSISISRQAIGLLATCSPDKSVRLWDLEHASGTPKCVGTKSMGAGALFDCAFDIDEPFMLATGGDEGLLALWDTAEDSNLEQIFRGRSAENLAPTAPPTGTVNASSTTETTSKKKNSQKKKKK